MAMVCPQCEKYYEQRLQCPTCGVRLQYQAGNPPPRGSGLRLAINNQWQQKPWGRLLVGLLLAQGLYFGLWHLCLAGILAVRPGQSGWDRLTAMLIAQGLQAVGLIAGGLLAGAGQRKAFMLGGMVGIWNGILVIMMHQLKLLPGFTVYEFNTVTLYGLPLIHMAFGAFGGFTGSLIWRPLPEIEVPTVKPRSNAVSLRWTAPRINPFTGPIAWVRVLAGSAVAIGGTFWAKVILNFFLEASEGKLSLDSHLEAKLVTWEISGLAMLLGGALAGATVWNSLKQGLCAGLGVATVLLGVRFATGGQSLEEMVLVSSCAAILCIVGSWFGGELFPPVIKLTKLRLTRPAYT